MLIRTGLLLTVALLPVIAQQSSSTTRTETKTLVIDGSKNPELFPQWYAWETFFRSLAAQRDVSALLERELRLSKEDATILVREANSFRRLEEALGKELSAVRTSLTSKGKLEDEIRDVTQQVNVDYRYRVLDGRSRVYGELSSEGLQEVLTRISKMLAATNLRLSGRTLEYFQRPW